MTYPTSNLDYGDGTAGETPVGSDDVRSIVVLTQAAYDLLTPDAATLYIIIG